MEHPQPAKKHYIFTFTRYEHTLMTRLAEQTSRRVRRNAKVAGWGLATFAVVGSIYPIMIWIEWGVHILEPRMNDYLLHRLK